MMWKDEECCRYEKDFMKEVEKYEQIKRGKFYRFCNNDAKIDFLAEVYNQFGIDLAKSCFDFYMKCEALAVSNSQDTILYRTKIYEQYQNYAFWQPQIKNNEIKENETTMHTLIKKYTDEDILALNKKYQELKNEVYENCEASKEIKEANEILTKYGIDNVSIKQAILPDKVQEELSKLDKHLDEETKSLIDKAIECQSIIEGSNDNIFVLDILKKYGFIREMNKKENK